jgi:DNA methylase
MRRDWSENMDEFSLVALGVAWTIQRDADGKFLTPDSVRPLLEMGSALKPAWEPICIARKPLIETVAENVLRHGTGAINVDACRVSFVGPEDATATAAARSFAASHARGTVTRSNSIGKESRDGTNIYDPFAIAGRWPANIVHDGSDEVLAAFPGGYAGSGSAARFFFSAKADAEDRMGSKHPTVKPIDLMQWLVRLVTPKGGIVLDPFAGSGTTGIAAQIEGCRAVLIEREATFAADIRIRLEHAQGLSRHSIGLKNRNKRKEPSGPLFAKDAS